MNISKKHKKLIDLGLVNFKPWRILDIKDDDYSKGLNSRYPNRNLIPFAIRTDCDDVACWDLSSKEDVDKVYIIHDFASEGWEQQEIFQNFEEWFNQALNDMFSFDLD